MRQLGMGGTISKQNKVKAGIEFSARILWALRKDEKTFWEERGELIEKQKQLYGLYWRLFRLLYSITSYQISRYNIIQYQIKSTEII